MDQETFGIRVDRDRGWLTYLCEGCGVCAYTSTYKHVDQLEGFCATCHWVQQVGRVWPTEDFARVWRQLVPYSAGQIYLDLRDTLVLPLDRWNVRTLAHVTLQGTLMLAKEYSP